MNKFLFLTLALLFLTSFSSANATTEHEVAKISAETVEKMISDGANLVIIDARRAKDFEKSHIAGAKSLPVDETNKTSLAAIVPDASTKIIFYCQNPKCIASHISAKKAIELGYKYIYVFAGGIDDWVAHGYAVEPKPAAAK